MLTEVQQRTAEQLFRTLGELKGGAMKFGQAMSIFEAALPEELAAPYREQLTRLQDSAPPMPTMTVREILAPRARRGLEGPPGRARPRAGRGGLDRPGAPGPLGRRPRGGGQGAVPRRRRGADLRPAPDRPGGPRARARWCPGIDIKPLVAELQARAVEELDYQLEAEAQRAFAAEFRDDPDIVVPDVVAARRHGAGHRVDGEHRLAGARDPRGHPGGARPLRLPLPAVHVRAPRPAPACCTPTRTRATSGCSRTTTAAPAGSACSTSAPSPGCPSGSCRASLGALIRIATDGGLRAAGHRACATRASSASASSIDADQLRAYLGPFLEPASVEEFQFSRAWMQEQFRRINDPRGDAYAAMLRLNLPPAYMLIHRTFAGGIGVLSQLEARVPFRQVLLDSLPGFAADARVELSRSAHHHSESSLLSIARRCSREQSSQNQRCLPFSTAEVQVIGGVVGLDDGAAEGTGDHVPTIGRRTRPSPGTCLSPGKSCSRGSVSW